MVFCFAQHRPASFGSASNLAERTPLARFNLTQSPRDRGVGDRPPTVLFACFAAFENDRGMAGGIITGSAGADFSPEHKKAVLYICEYGKVG